MTEGEWLTCGNPMPMLAFLPMCGYERKLRLFACACCRGAFEVVPGAKGLDAVEFAERYADGDASEEERLERLESGPGPHPPATVTRQTAVAMAVRATLDHNSSCLNSTQAASHFAGRAHADDSWRAVHAGLLRDIFGNPFDPVTFPTRWLTRDVLAIAKGLYDARDFSAMPILADALQDAGCGDEVVLAHCRGPGPHVRGCWVTDACLGKS